MSCNPAIGGIGKGHLVREIDALGGAMARAADRAGIQLRTLNASKGPAVRATRAQADRQLYRSAIRALSKRQPNLQLFQQEVADLEIVGEQVRAVTTRHRHPLCGARRRADRPARSSADASTWASTSTPADGRATRPRCGLPRGCGSCHCASGA